MQNTPQPGATVYWNSPLNYSGDDHYVSAKVLYTSERDGRVSVTVDRPAIPWQPNGYNLTLPLDCLLEAIPDPVEQPAIDPVQALCESWNPPFRYNGD